MDGQKLEKLQTLFVQNVSHELRTPLSVLHGYSTMLAQGDFGPLLSPQAQATDILMRTSERLIKQIELIEALLAIESSQIYFQPVLLGQIIAQMIERIRPGLPITLELDLSIQADEPLIQGDQSLLTKLLDCLLENAIKFTSVGRITVTLAHDGHHLTLSVADTGIGMSPADVALVTLFHFYQADGTTSRQHGGVGLGLTVVGAVMRAHAGQVEVASQLGKGSQFRLVFPVAAPPRHSRLARTPSSQPRRILIVDDDVAVAKMLQAGIERLPGCEVVMVTHPHQALALAQETHFELIITDYLMPDMDGLTLAEAIRSITPDIIVILLTASNTAVVRDRPTHGTVQYVLDKPVQLKHIRDLTLAALDSDRSVRLARGEVEGTRVT